MSLREPVAACITVQRSARGQLTRPTTTGSEVVQTVPTVLLALLVIFVMPVWPHSRGWGWPPAGILAMGLATLVLFSMTVVPE